MRSLIFLFLIGIFSIDTLPGESLRAPVEGYVFDAPSGSLRAVNGFPGSATFGPAVLSGLEFASVAPSEAYGIACKSGACVFVSGLNAGHFSTAAVAGLVGTPEGAAWSRDGAVAVLYSLSGKWIQTVSGFPKAPSAKAHQDLSSMSGALTAVAADSSGAQIAIALRGSGGGVYLNKAGASLIPLAKMANPSALSFSTDGATLYALDRGARELAVITISDWNSRMLALPELQDPFAIRAGHDSANEPLIFVASAKDRMVGVYNPATQKMQTAMRLRFQPTGFEDLGPNSFVIASRSKSTDPLWLFTSAPRTAVYFVPAVPTTKEQQ